MILRTLIKKSIEFKDWQIQDNEHIEQCNAFWSEKGLKGYFVATLITKKDISNILIRKHPVYGFDVEYVSTIFLDNRK